MVTGKLAPLATPCVGFMAVSAGAGGRFTVNLPPPPALTAMNPTQGLQGASVPVTITGTALSNGTLAVGTGITASGVTVVSDTQINATLVLAANAPLGPATVAVTTLGGTSNALTFTINPPPPVLTGIAPNTGATGSSVPVTISGSFLTGATLIVPADITVSGVTVGASSITATFAPAANAALGAHSISVTTAGGTSGAVTFNVIPPPPVIALIAPAAGLQGASVPVSITGSFLTGGAIVVGGGITATGVTVVSDTQINATFVMAVNATLGAHTVSVTTLGGTSAAASFTVNQPPPTLTGIAPAQGGQNSTVPVTFSGTFLTGVTLNLPAGITATAVVATGTQITANLAIAATATLGTNTISVTTGGGTSNSVNFTVNPPAPALTSIQPTSLTRPGAGSSTTTVTFNGANLDGTTLASFPVMPGVTLSNLQIPVGTRISQVKVDFTLTNTTTRATYQMTITTAGGTSNALPFTIN